MWLFYDQPHGETPCGRFSDRSFFLILVSFLSFSDFSKNFQEKNFEKKKTENFDEKNFREKILRKKFKMENQRKNWRVEKFLKKKLGNRGTFKRKKILQWKNFAKKNQNLGSSASPPPLARPATSPAAAPRLPAASREADPAAAAPEEPAAAPQPPCACLRHRIRSQDGWGRRPPAGLGREERPRRHGGCTPAGRREELLDVVPRRVTRRRGRCSLPAAAPAPCRVLQRRRRPAVEEAQRRCATSDRLSSPGPKVRLTPTSLTAQIQAAPHQGSRGDR